MFSLLSIFPAVLWRVCAVCIPVQTSGLLLHPQACHAAGWCWWAPTTHPVCPDRECSAFNSHPSASCRESSSQPFQWLTAVPPAPASGVWAQLHSSGRFKWWWFWVQQGQFVCHHRKVITVWVSSFKYRNIKPWLSLVMCYRAVVRCQCCSSTLDWLALEKWVGIELFALLTGASHGWESFTKEGMTKKRLFPIVYINSRLLSRKGIYARNESAL